MIKSMNIPFMMQRKIHGCIYEGYDKRDAVAITFDDGPNPEVTPEILKILKSKNVKATFFLVGKNIEKYPEIARQITRDGHDISNHTYTHPRLVDLYENINQGEQDVINEIQNCIDTIKKITGLAEEEIRFFRPPFTSWNEELGRVVEPFYGHRVVMSTVGSSDWDWDNNNHQWNDVDDINSQTKKILESVRKKIKPGSIIALHDSAHYGIKYSNWAKRAVPTLKALPTIIDDIKMRGYKVVKLSQMEFKGKNDRH